MRRRGEIPNGGMLFGSKVFLIRKFFQNFYSGNVFLFCQTLLKAKPNANQALAFCSEMCHWIAPVSEAVGLLESEADFDFNFEFDIDTEKVEDLVKCKPFSLPPPSPDYELLIHKSIDKAPGPPAGTGYHRYVFILLEGSNTNLTLPDTRQHWGTGKEGHGIRDWAKREGLVVVGGNYFKEKQ